MNTSTSLANSNPDEQFELGIAILNKAWKAKELSMIDEMEGLKRLAQKKQEEIHQQSQQYSKLQFEFQSLNTNMKTLQDMNQDLQAERDKLSMQVKLLTSELSKLKAFKKSIIQSLNFGDMEEQGNSQLMNASNLLSNVSQLSEEPAIRFVPPPTQNVNTSTVPNPPSFQSQQLPPQQLTSPQEGKEFFKQAKEVLTTRQFTEFLQQIKLLNNQQQSAPQTLENVNAIFKGEHPILIEGFKRILAQRQQQADQGVY